MLEVGTEVRRILANLDNLLIGHVGHIVGCIQQEGSVYEVQFPGVLCRYRSSGNWHISADYLEEIIKKPKASENKAKDTEKYEKSGWLVRYSYTKVPIDASQIVALIDKPTYVERDQDDHSRYHIYDCLGPEARFEDLLPGAVLYCIRPGHGVGMNHVVHVTSTPHKDNSLAAWAVKNNRKRQDFVYDLGILAPDREGRGERRSYILKRGIKPLPKYDHRADEPIRCTVAKPTFKEEMENSFRKRKDELMCTNLNKLAEQIKTETKMTDLYSNHEALVLLARGDSMPSVPGFEAAPTAVKEALARKMKREQDEAAETAAEQIVEVLKVAAADEVRRAKFVRDLNAKIKDHKEAGATRDRALAYAEETGNYLPLALLMCLIPSYCEDEETARLRAIPKDWAPASATRV